MSTPAAGETYRPFYARDGNRVLGYEERLFGDRHGHWALLCYARYVDRKGMEHEALARVKWLD